MNCEKADDVLKTPVQNDEEVTLSPMPYYDMSKRGYAVIFNQFECKGYSQREGTFNDTERLKNCLERLNFGTNVQNDLTRNQIFTIMHQVRCMTDISCLIVVVLTHGENHNQVSAKDGLYSVSHLWEFLDEKLLGVPKLFFIQACRGKEEDRGYDENDSGIPCKKIKLPKNSDFLQMYSSSEQYFSYRESKGSWFIIELCEVLEKYADSMNLLELLTFVNKRIAYKYTLIYKGKKYKQMSQIVSTLSKSLKFNTDKYNCHHE